MINFEPMFLWYCRISCVVHKLAQHTFISLFPICFIVTHLTFIYVINSTLHYCFHLSQISFKDTYIYSYSPILSVLHAFVYIHIFIWYYFSFTGQISLKFLVGWIYWWWKLSAFAYLKSLYFTFIFEDFWWGKESKFLFFFDNLKRLFHNPLICIVNDMISAAFLNFFFKT